MSITITVDELTNSVVKYIEGGNMLQGLHGNILHLS